MGASGSGSADADFDLQLPQQQVVSSHGGALPFAGGSSWDPPMGVQVTPSAGRAVPLAERKHTDQVKIPLVWDKTSLRLQRAEGQRHAWHLSAAFEAQVPCVLSAHFHSRGRLGPRGMEYSPCARDAPPSFSQQCPAGKGSALLSGDRAINLQRWPLEVFWRYKKKKADVLPIVLLLSAGDVQSAIHLSLEVPPRSENSGEELRCTLLQQKVVVGGREYLLQEIYGLSELGHDAEHDESSHGEPCVICLCEPRTTAVTPCSHLCVCEDCGRHLQAGVALRNDRCPVCRGPIEGLQVFDVKT